MPIFIVPFLWLATLFSQNGKPAVVPPHTLVSVQVHGQEVSQIAKNLGNQSVNHSDSPSLNPLNTYNPAPAKSEGIERDDPNLNVRNTIPSPINPQPYVLPTVINDDNNSSSNDKIETVNDKSVKPMPVEVPQNAVEKSPALSPATAPTTGPHSPPTIAPDPVVESM